MITKRVVVIQNIIKADNENEDIEEAIFHFKEIKKNFENISKV